MKELSDQIKKLVEERKLAFERGSPIVATSPGQQVDWPECLRQMEMATYLTIELAKLGKVVRGLLYAGWVCRLHGFIWPSCLMTAGWFLAA